METRLNVYSVYNMKKLLIFAFKKSPFAEGDI